MPPPKYAPVSVQFRNAIKGGVIARDRSKKIQPAHIIRVTVVGWAYFNYRS